MRRRKKKERRKKESQGLFFLVISDRRIYLIFDISTVQTALWEIIFQSYKLTTCELPCILSLPFWAIALSYAFCALILASSLFKLIFYLRVWSLPLSGQSLEITNDTGRLYTLIMASKPMRFTLGLPYLLYSDYTSFISHSPTRDHRVLLLVWFEILTLLFYTLKRLLSIFCFTEACRLLPNHVPL